MRGWFDSTFGSLHNRHYRILWTGSLLGVFSYFVSWTVQSIVAFDLTGNNRAVGFVIFAQGVAMLVLAPFGGALADRVSKRVLLFICQGSIGLSYLALAILIVTDNISVAALAGAAFVAGVAFSLMSPARQAYIGQLVEPDQRGNAVAVSQIAMNAGRVAGPFLAGALVAWKAFGAGGTYFFLAALYIPILWTLLILPPSSGTKQAGSTIVGDMVEGMRYIWHTPLLRILVLQLVTVVMLAFPYVSIMPGYVENVFGKGDATLGVMLGISAVGGLVASIGVASIARTPRAGSVLTMMVVVLGAATILTGLAPSLGLAMLTIFFLGAANGGFQTLNSAIAFQAADPVYYGRIMSVTMIAFSAFGLMALPLGFIADAAGERTAFVIMGIGVLVAALSLGLLAQRMNARRVGRPVPQSGVGGGA